MARLTKYRAEYADQARKLCRLGAIDMEIADFFGVGVATLNRWKKEYPDFMAAIREGKSAADAEVADKLFRRATGYEHEACKIVADAKTGAHHVVPYTERYAPDTTACIFWLKNRRPDLWRDRVEQQLEHGGSINSEITRIELVGVAPA